MGYDGIAQHEKECGCVTHLTIHDFYPVTKKVFVPCPVHLGGTSTYKKSTKDKKDILDILSERVKDPAYIEALRDEVSDKAADDLLLFVSSQSTSTEAYNRVIELLQSKGATDICCDTQSTTYDEVEYVCRCGRKITNKIASVLYNEANGCKSCSRPSASFEAVREIYNSHNIELPTQEYGGVKKKMVCSCAKCGKSLNLCLTEVRRGRGCRQCK